MAEEPLLESPGAPVAESTDSSAEEAIRTLRARADRDVGKIAGDPELRAFLVDRFEVKQYTGFSSGEDLLDNLKAGSDRYQEACTDLLHILAGFGWYQQILHQSIAKTLGGDQLEQEMKQTVELLRQHSEDPAVLLAGCQALSASMMCEDFMEVAHKQEVWKLMVQLLEMRGEDVAFVSAALPVLQWTGARLGGEGVAPAFFEMKGYETVSGLVRSHSAQTRILHFGANVFAHIGESSPDWMPGDRLVEEVCLPALVAPQDRWALRAYYPIHHVLRSVGPAGDSDLEKLLLDSGMVQQLLNRMEEFPSDVTVFELCCRILRILTARLAKDGQQADIQAVFEPLLWRVALAAPAIVASQDPETKQFVMEMLACISVKAAMPLALQDAATEGPAASAEFDEILKESSQMRYSWISFVMDTVLPSGDLFIDTVALITYLQEREHQFFGIIGCSMVFNSFGTTLFAKLFYKTMPKWKLALNFCTFGLYFMFQESRACSDTGMKTPFLHVLKLFEGVESLTSFLVGSYSLLIAGFVPGYRSLLLTSTVVRFVSIGFSLLTLPLTAYGIGYADISSGAAGDRVDAYRKSLNSKRFLCGMELPMGMVALFAFQACEIYSQLVLLVFQLATRPAGIFVLLATHLFLWHALCYWELRWAGLMHEFKCMRQTFSGPIGLAFTPATKDHADQLRNRLHVLLRLVALAVAWAVVVQQVLTRDDLAEHLLKPLNMALIAVAAVGSIGFPFMVAHQWRAGRWSPPPKPKEASASYELLPEQSTSGNEVIATTEV